jgi:hypothetical protein
MLYSIFVGYIQTDRRSIPQYTICIHEKGGDNLWNGLDDSNDQDADHWTIFE